MARHIEGIEYLTVEEAAVTLKTTVPGILMLLRQHDLNGREVGGNWLVPAASLGSFTANPKNMKSEIQCRSRCSSGGCGCR